MKTGIAILSGMAGIWAGWSVHAGHLSQWAYVGAAVIALVPLVLMTRRRFGLRTKDEARRIGRLVGLASFAEVVAIVVGVQVLAHAGRPDLIVSLIAVVVGLHFLPLARWIPMPKYYVSGLALVTTACTGVAIPAEHRVLFVASTASAILWLTALSVVLAAPAMSLKAQ
jgi:hypothetical protein